MVTKSCELDPPPTNIFKKAIENERFLQMIMWIISLLLNSGQFASVWKRAIIRLLLKKLGLEIIWSSYRLISILSFVSKLIEKCFLDQFLDYCETSQIASWLSVGLQEEWQHWNSIYQGMWWPSVGHGTTACVILYCNRFISHFWHSGPWCPLKCIGKQLWGRRKSPGVVWHLPTSKTL